MPLTSSSVIDAAAHRIMLSPPLLTSENASRAMSAVGGEAANEAKEAQSQAADEAQSRAVAVVVCARCGGTLATPCRLAASADSLAPGTLVLGASLARSAAAADSLNTCVVMNLPQKRRRSTHYGSWHGDIAAMGLFAG